MSKQTQDNELRTRFNTVWANRTTVAWPNAAFTPPSPQVPWVRFTITDGEGRQTTIGSPTNNHAHTGVLFISIFAPTNAGDAIANQRADEAAAIFRNWCGTNIRCRAVTIKSIGVFEGWYQINVQVPFRRDELL
jgi:hypothetical protein